MDSIVNFASQQLSGQGQQQNNGQQQQEGQQQQQQQGGNGGGLNIGALAGLAGSALGGGGGQQQQGGGGLNLGSLISGANQQHGNGDALSGMIGTALGKAQNVGPDAQINEQAVQKDHDQAYNQGNAAGLSASAMGSAAAIQAFKSFASGGQQQQSGGGSMIEKLLGMAMSEAAKLFDKSGGAASGNKQDVMNSAGETVMKLLVQNQIQGRPSADDYKALGGGGGGGGAGQLIGLASKFLK
ncbi:uncharacterized protein LOC62_03G004086 [Vanrija pseudolonga]|uniref:DUF7721 domain-containing protein n=1 Tax=Vanrija pseudolonga TaxID=143232 RepID=A0AAF1BH24_9TREE|nr:hypothetical protein LOC62_03G004086 [Vanrija pseudolonga]